MTISYRLFDFEKDDIESLFELYKITYGDDTPYRERWDWEYKQNPKKDEIKIIIAESDGKLAGSTTRLPFTIKSGEVIINTAFSVNSMVHPEFRRMGIMDNLYHMGAELYEVLFSKGTMPGMYKLLMRMGYKPVKPDTYAVALLSPLRWIMWKLKWYQPDFRLSNLKMDSFEEYMPVERFSNAFDEFQARCVHGGDWVGIIKDSEYMNWRYIDNPLKTYRAFYGKINGRIVSMVVFSNNGSTGKIVDLLWDTEIKNEPYQTIKFAKKFFKKNGFLKVSCWSLIPALRDILKKNGFIERSEIMQLSIFSKHSDNEIMTGGKTFGFVEGDGDVEYLS